MTSRKPGRKRLTNLTTAGVVYTAEGHSIGGGEHLTVDDVDEVGRAAIGTGQLRLDDGASHRE